MSTEDGDEKTCYSPLAAGVFPKDNGHLGCHPSLHLPWSIDLPWPEDSKSVSTTIFCYSCMYCSFRSLYALVCTCRSRQSPLINVFPLVFFLCHMCVHVHNLTIYSKKSNAKKLADWKLLSKKGSSTRGTVCTRGIDTFSVLARSLTHTLTPI